MSNLWYILNKSEHQQRLNQQLQQQLRQQLELPPSGMSSDRFQFPTNNTPAAVTTTSPTAGSTPVTPSRDLLPFGQQQFPPQHPDGIPFDPNAPAVPPGESHNNIEWKYHTHRPEADGDALGRKAGKRKLVIPRDLLKMKQMNAALKIGIPPSTFSKRWRESLPDRTWPYRNHRRIEKNIKMLKAMQQKGHDVTEELGKMQQQQEENLSPAVIDVYEDVNEEYLMKVDEKKWPPAATTSTGGRPPGSGPPTPHHHPYAQLPPSQTPQLQIAAISHSQMGHPLGLQQQQHPLPHSPTSKLVPQQPHQQAQAQPPIPQTTPLQASPIQTSPIQPTNMQSPPVQVQTSTVLTSPVLASPVQTTPIQTTPIPTTSMPTTSTIQTSPIQTSPIQTASLQPALQPALQSPSPIPAPQQIQALPQQPTLQIPTPVHPQTSPQDTQTHLRADPQHPIDPHRQSPQQAQQHPELPPSTQPIQSEPLPLKIEQIPQTTATTSPHATSPAPTQPQEQTQQPQPSTFPQVQLSTPPT